jgi:rSAM/selenodomain-associated transferase 1
VTPAALLVIAKEPLPGCAKTRLTPPCSPEQAAKLAKASLLDTLDVVARTPAARRVLVFAGDGHAWRPPGFELIQQRGKELGERLAAAFEDIASPALLVGMDTPQLTPPILLEAINALAKPHVDAVLGPALDGGYWSVGFNKPAPGAFAGVPMSSSETLDAQRVRLGELGLRVHEQPALRAVAGAAPHTRFARALAAI